MTQLPTVLPGPTPGAIPGAVPALPGSLPTPHDPTAADPFLALLAQLVGGPVPVPGGAGAAPDAPGQPTDGADGGTDDGSDDPSTNAEPTAVVATLPVVPQLAAALRATPGAAAKTAAAPTTDPAEGAAGALPIAVPKPLPSQPQPQPAIAGPDPAPVTAPSLVVPGLAPAAQVGAPAPGPAPAAAPVAHQVFPEVVRLAVTGETPKRVVIRLEPEQLGEVRVVLRTGTAGLEVSLAAGTDARTALREGAPELRRMLEAAGSPDARILLRHLPDAPGSPAAPAAPPPAAAAPVAPPTPVRTDAQPTGLTVDVGAGTAGGTAHGDRRDRAPQDAAPTATDGLPDRPLEPAWQIRAAGGLDVMM